MVVFTCSYCGDSVKKNQVEKHYTFKRCSSRKPALTCVDCLKDFMDQEYVAHTSCVTEAERYSAKGFVAKPPRDTGKRKQEMWLSAVNDFLNSGASLDNKVRRIVQQISSDPGLPQKKARFINFCHSKRVVYQGDTKTLECVWEVLEKVKEDLRNKSKDNVVDKNCDSQEDRKRKRVDSGNESSNSDEKSLDKSLTENSNTSPSELKKKVKSKKNSFKSVPEEPEVNINDVEESVINIEDSNQCVDIVEVNGKNKSKKRRKLQKNGELEHLDGSEPSPLNGSMEKSETIKLSKKERKKKLKQEKYEKELMNVQNEVTDELVENEVEEETEKKKKKKKKHDKVSNGPSNEGSFELQSHEESKKQGKKKNNIESQEVKENEFHGNILDVEDSKPSKFNWEDTIIKVLESKGELPLKRLEKKVVNEYLNCHEYASSIEEVKAKFSRKILKIPRVKVKKEVARLIF